MRTLDTKDNNFVNRNNKKFAAIIHIFALILSSCAAQPSPSPIRKLSNSGSCAEKIAERYKLSGIQDPIPLLEAIQEEHLLESSEIEFQIYRWKEGKRERIIEIVKQPHSNRFAVSRNGKAVSGSFANVNAALKLVGKNAELDQERVLFKSRSGGESVYVLRGTKDIQAISLGTQFSCEWHSSDNRDCVCSSHFE